MTTGLLPQILAESAHNYPNRVAVELSDDKITYLELDRISNQLANTLKKSGVQYGDRVAIYLSKSIKTIISIFAILKANAICVPLDPTGPTQRNSYIINDCQVKCLISHSNKRRGLIALVSSRTPLTNVILLSDKNVIEDFVALNTVLWNDVLIEPGVASKPVVIDIDPAYILYTSGSTGEPKGVIISHLNALTFINWAASFFNIDNTDKVSSHAPLHFDLSIFDIFVTMKCGGSVCLVPPEINALPKDLIKFIAEHKITVWQSVPSVLVLLTNSSELEKHTLHHLRFVLFAGETFPTKFLRKLMLTLPSPSYYNIYGATEINDVACYHIKKPPIENDPPVPIGKACSFVELFAIDANNKRITTPGVIGELYARGSNISIGYWGNHKASKEHFLQNPLNSMIADPVYKTGDLVELDKNDDFRYVGRSDSQVKIRGFRVNLVEVENVLLRYKDIDEVSVVALSDDNEARFLKAYIVAKNGTIIDQRQLKQHCLKFIPKYMLPEELEQRTSLPKTSTGKVDKRKLTTSRVAEFAD